MENEVTLLHQTDCPNRLGFFWPKSKPAYLPSIRVTNCTYYSSILLNIVFYLLPFFKGRGDPEVEMYFFTNIKIIKKYSS